MSTWKTPLFALAAAALLSACSRAPSPTPEPAPSRSADDAYVQPPAVRRVLQAGRTVTLTGDAAPGARVRLATPQGDARYALADSKGAWSLALPVAPRPSILGLSSAMQGRQAQSQGYLLLTPSGQSALLRAGSGAIRLDSRPAVAIGAFDFDREGGAVVSGSAPAGAPVILKLDGRQAAEVRADAGGRFSVSLASPVEPGRHTLAIAGDGFVAQARVDVTPAAPLTDGPFRSTLTRSDVRADWMTPGGGVQSTLILG